MLVYKLRSITLKLLIAIIVGVLSTSAFAGQYATPFGTITNFRAYGDTNVNQPTYIQIQGAPIREGCSHADFGNGDLNYFLIKPEDKNVLSIALAAFMSGKEVKITSNDTNSFMHNNEVCRVIYLDVGA